jgi:CHAT domain-containing protein/tetratricopeptide (TPR) repeat protein
MQRILVVLAMALGAFCSAFSADCRTYKNLVEEAVKKQSWTDTFSYLQRQHRENPGDHCIEYALGLYYEYQDQYQTALTHFQASIKMNPAYCQSYTRVGWIYHALRKYNEARKYFEDAINVARRIGDQTGEAEAEIELGILYTQRGNPDKAIKHLSEAANLSKIAKATDYEARALVRLAEALQELDEHAEAEKKCREALELHKATNDRRIWFDYQILGDIHLSAGDAALDSAHARDEYSKAVASYIQAQDTAWDLRQKQMLLISLGDAYLKMNEEETALRYYQSLLKEASETDRSVIESRSWAMGRIGEIYARRGDYGPALVHLNQAIALAKEDVNKKLEMSWIKATGDVYAEMGEYEKARECYERVLKEVKDGFLELDRGSNEEKYVFFENESDVYEALVDLLLKMDQRNPEGDYAREAFDYLERARAQSMLQVLYHSRIVEKVLQGNSRDEFREALARLQEEVHRRHQARLDARAEKMKTRNADLTKQLDNKIKALEGDIADLYKQILSLIKRKLPDYYTYQVAERIQKEVLKNNEALIEYLVMNDKTFVFVITKEAFYHDVIPIGRKGRAGRSQKVQNIRQLMRQVSPLFQAPDQAVPRARVDASWADIQLKRLNELYQAIFQPTERHLRPGDQLIIVPDDILYYLPFEMLVPVFQRSEAPRYLLSRYPISYAYSASLLLQLPKNAEAKSEMSLLMANPDFGQAASTPGEVQAGFEPSRSYGQGRKIPQLPYAEEEVQRVRKILKNSVTLMGAQATEAAFKRNASQAGIIHIATHSIFDRLNYLDSKIIFAQGPIDQQGEDGILYLHEIMNLRLNTNLVILTGCETSLGRLQRGSGLEGISRAFLSANVPSVIGTLWPIGDSKATSNLMVGFYKYIAKGMNKREALQKAKLDLIAAEPYTDPFYWAAPILIGDTHPLKVSEHRSFSLMILIAPSLALLLLLYFVRAQRTKRH